ncbi:hypothetical protein WKS98_08345 [Lagierella sp. ICN-221743]
MLTDRQEIYVQELLNGKSQRQAYRIAYPKSKKWKDSTIDSRASKLFKDDKVFTRYSELKKQEDIKHTEKRLWKREDAEKGLIWIIQEAQKDIQKKGFRQANSSAFINAIKELKELNGLGDLNEAKIKNDNARTEKIYAEIEKIKGISEEIEDLSEIDSFIYGDD